MSKLSTVVECDDGDVTLALLAVSDDEDRMSDVTIVADDHGRDEVLRTEELETTDADGEPALWYILRQKREPLNWAKYNGRPVHFARSPPIDHPLVRAAVEELNDNQYKWYVRRLAAETLWLKRRRWKSLTDDERVQIFPSYLRRKAAMRRRMNKFKQPDVYPEPPKSQLLTHAADGQEIKWCGPGGVNAKGERKVAYKQAKPDLEVWDCVLEYDDRGYRIVYGGAPCALEGGRRRRLNFDEDSWQRWWERQRPIEEARMAAVRKRREGNAAPSFVASRHAPVAESISYLRATLGLTKHEGSTVECAGVETPFVLQQWSRGASIPVRVIGVVGFDELAVRPVDSDVEATFWSLTRHLANGAAIGRLGEAVTEVCIGHAYVVHILSMGNNHYMRALCIQWHLNDEAHFYLFDIGTSVTCKLNDVYQMPGELIVKPPLCALVRARNVSPNCAFLRVVRESRCEVQALNMIRQMFSSACQMVTITLHDVIDEYAFLSDLEMKLNDGNVIDYSVWLQSQSLMAWLPRGNMPSVTNVIAGSAVTPTWLPTRGLSVLSSESTIDDYCDDDRW